MNNILRRIDWKKGIEKIPWKREEFVLSLDIGTSAIKWVLLRNSKEGPLFLEGGMEDPKNLRAILEKKATSKKCRVRIAISGPKVLLKRVLLPKMPPQEIETALRWQVKEEIPFPIQEVYLDFQEIRSIEKEGKHLLDLLVGVVHKELVDSLLSIGPFEIDTIEPALLLLPRLFSLEKRNDYALIDLGASTTHVGIFHEGILEMAREISIGGETLTQALTCEIMIGEKKCSLGKEEAEKAKLSYGISQETSTASVGTEMPPEKLWVLMRPILERLLGDLERFFQFYEKRDPPREIQEVWVTGGGAGLQHLDDLLKRHLGLAPEGLSFLSQFRFSQGFLRDTPQEEIERRLGVAVAAALPRKEIINFLPPSVKASRQWRFRVRMTKTASFLTIIFLAGFQLFFAIERVALKNAIQKKKKIWEELASQRETYMRWMDKKKHAEKVVQTFSNFLEREPLWEGVLKELSWLVPKAVSLKELKMENGSLSQGKKNYRVHLKGEVGGSKESAEETLTHFLEALEASPFFEGIRLVSTEGEASSEGGIPFEVTGQLELEGASKED
ncbi:MAG: pilus assembly protein PilM [Candidatus Omnitrophica bacterium]|nr:pilus assembly protein PilM [Candidatus Omnitrophota bacterium]